MNIDRKYVRTTAEIIDDVSANGRQLDGYTMYMVVRACYPCELDPEEFDFLMYFKTLSTFEELKKEAILFVNAFEKEAIKRNFKYIELLFGKGIISIKEIISIKDYFSIVRYQINHYVFDAKYKDPRSYLNIEILNVDKKAIKTTRDITNDISATRMLDYYVKKILDCACSTCKQTPEVIDTIMSFKDRPNFEELKKEAVLVLNNIEAELVKHDYKYVQCSEGQEILYIKDYFSIVRYQINHYIFDVYYKNPKNYKNIEILNPEEVKKHIFVGND